jgi:thiol-disulfide isomerase/thioredoxin
MLGLLGSLLLLAGGSARTQEKSAPAVDVRMVKYDGLADAIMRNRGKVVVVDFWADTCLPCKKAFPHLVQLYKTHHRDGLAAISVAIDPCWGQYNAAVKEKIEKFLRDKGAVFTNLILDETKELLEKKLRVAAVPCLYVFSRQGTWTQFTGDNLKKDDEGRYYEVEALVKKLLAEK